MAKRDKKKKIDQKKLEKVLDSLPEFLLLKQRSGRTVVLTCGSKSCAKELYEALKTKFENKDFRTVVGEPNMLKGSSMNISQMNMAVYGSMDPDTEMLREVSKGMWEAAWPKPVVVISVGIPMVFGTRGSKMGGADYFQHMWNSANKNYNVPTWHENKENEHSSIYDV